jgi:hypothetical protein
MYPLHSFTKRVQYYASDIGDRMYCNEVLQLFIRNTKRKQMFAMSSETRKYTCIY